MQTHFSLAQLADPDLREADKILRACVHCGFCTATCPTYVLLGDELDGPRGRIYLIKEMLEKGRAATEPVVKHIDRCLSCLSCMTTCPSGVNYQHLVDQARHHIEQSYRRPLADRVLRDFLAAVLPRPRLFRLALRAAALARPIAWLLPARLRGIAALAPRRVPAASPVDRPQVFPAQGTRKKRVALLAGCAQQVVAPQINEATIRLLTRHGCEVVIARGAGCCGGLTHHMGRPSLGFAKANIDAWTRVIEEGGLDALVVNASGCGVTIRDYGYLLREDAGYRDKAARISALTKDLSELLAEIGLAAPATVTGRRVAYHSACSLQHGLGVREAPKALLAKAGFVVLDVPEAHLCCGSAGTYNMLQPEIAERLRERKQRNIASTGAELVAAGNVGCITQLAQGALPVLHTAELLDWATGGPMPTALSSGARPASGR
jgi:glycolate oxidase iron-sulfur subunit